MSKILVFGHQNPDTDAIGAAISFAYLQILKHHVLSLKQLAKQTKSC